MKVIGKIGNVFKYLYDRLDFLKIATIFHFSHVLLYCDFAIFSTVSGV